MQNNNENEDRISALLTVLQTSDDSRLRSESFAALCALYAPLMTCTVRKFSRSPFYDEGEFYEEAQIALFRAALTYRGDRNTTFGLYAAICIRNRLLSFLRRESAAHTRDIGIEDVYPIADSARDPGDMIAMRDAFRVTYNRFLASLTAYEKRVFAYYIRGASYGEIARALSVCDKSVENAVYRIRVKLKRQLLKRETTEN